MRFNQLFGPCLTALLSVVGALWMTAMPFKAEARVAPAFADVTYYVDFENGNDAQNGLSMSAAWKHAPGDPAATGNPRTITLEPGDTVLFKGGVVYRGQIEIETDGTLSQPITYKGDGWGMEKAILEGSKLITTAWTQCESASACGDNPDWQKIHYTAAPAGVNFTAGFFEDDDFIWQAQDPDPVDPFYYDQIDDFRVIPYNDPAIHQTRTSITDPRHFTQTDPAFWQGAYVIAWHIPNVTSIKKITSFDPTTHTIYHEDLGGDIYTDRDTYYAVLNHMSLLNKPGEYVLDENAGRFYVWPAGSDQPTQHTYSFLENATGIYASGQQHLVIEGFTLQKFTMGIRAIGEAGDVVIRNNTVRLLRSNNWYAVQVSGDDMRVENNSVSDCQRAVGILAAGHNITVKDNLVRRTSRQGIWFMGVNHGEIVGNTVTDIRGTHSNGISVYLYNQDILMANNQVRDTNSAMTYHGDNDPELVVNLIVFNNFFEGPVNSWGNDMRGVTILNNTFLSGIFMPDEDREVVFINNIVKAGGGGEVRSHNVYIGLSWWQQPRYGWAPGPGEIVGWDTVAERYIPIDPATVLADPARGYYTQPGSPAIDTGTDVTAYLSATLFPDFDFSVDIEGQTRPYGVTWDMGAYEAYPEVDLRGVPANQAIHLNWTLNVTPPLTSTWRISYYSQTVPITIDNIVSSTRSYSLTDLTNYAWYTITLNAMLDATPFLTDTIKLMPTDRLVYLPLIRK